MEIILYKYSGESNRLDKKLDEDSCLKIDNANFNRDFDLMNPIIKLVSSADLREYNYIFLDGLYYFVDSISVERSGFHIFHCTIDVLMSYKDVILSQTGKVVQSKNPLYLSDASIPYDTNMKLLKKTFPKSNFTSDGNFVLIGLGVIEDV